MAFDFKDEINEEVVFKLEKSPRCFIGIIFVICGGINWIMYNVMILGSMFYPDMTIVKSYMGNDSFNVNYEFFFAEIIGAIVFYVAIASIVEYIFKTMYITESLVIYKRFNNVKYIEIKDIRDVETYKAKFWNIRLLLLDGSKVELDCLNEDSAKTVKDFISKRMRDVI